MTTSPSGSAGVAMPCFKRIPNTFILCGEHDGDFAAYCSDECETVDKRRGFVEGLSLIELAKTIGSLVAAKQEQYGDSAGKSSALLLALYPDGIPVHAYSDALLMLRVLDKLCRLAQREANRLDKGGESPWVDIAGYALLGARKDDKSEKQD